ncbi:MAG: M14 family metallopeptidase [Flavobacteriales bacterium]
MKYTTILLLFCSTFISCVNNTKSVQKKFSTVFEKSNGQQTATYQETINFYKNLADNYTSIAIYTMKKTDCGKPLNLVTFNPERSFESEFNNKTKNILLINNGIHPGESDGIDASMLLLRDLAQHKIKTPKNTIIAVIPIYNIGGSLNRNATSRTNQNGPQEYGFRGNARNYDLNRDFIKADTKNAKAFIDIFRMLKPQVFIDTHVSNGADYQYTLTHLFTQHNKLGGKLGHYLHNVLMPTILDSLQKKQLSMTPYVNVFNKSPEVGFSQFLDSPRYSTGYTALYGTLGMMIETHMLKPYKQRVEATYELLKSIIAITDLDAKKIQVLTSEAYKKYNFGKNYPISWQIDSTQTTTIAFKGYEASFIPSKLTNASRLKFNRKKPFTKNITYFNYFKPKDSITIPKYYIIPQGWWNIIELLKLNKIKMKRVKKDSTLRANIYKIKKYETVSQPFEGHYLHYNTKVESITEKIKISKGDYLINTAQEGVRYLLETLEPTSPDSFFNWNYFDTVLQQKEGFSPYVWEDKAFDFLEQHPELKKQFEIKKQEVPNFNANWYLQLDWIHKQSPNYEKAHLRYPIIRVGG